MPDRWLIDCPYINNLQRQLLSREIDAQQLSVLRYSITLFQQTETETIEHDVDEHEDMIIGSRDLHLTCDNDMKNVLGEDNKLKRTLGQFGVITESKFSKDGIRIRYDRKNDAKYASCVLKSNHIKVVDPSQVLGNNVEKRTEEGIWYENRAYSGSESKNINNGVTPQSQNLGKAKPNSGLSRDGSFCSFYRYFRKHPKTVCCGFSYCYCCTLSLFSFVATLVGSIVMMARAFGVNVKVGAFVEL